MRSSIHRTPKYHSFVLQDLSKGKKALLGFSVVMAFFFVSDSIMSYLSPALIEKHTANRLLMGLIISSSSAVGLICDILLPKMFPNKKYNFFTFWTIITAAIFPLIFMFLPAHIAFYLLAMAIWGIYYELARFSQFNFVHNFLNHDEHAGAWGTLEIAKTLALTVGPVIASLFLSKNEKIAAASALISLVAALIGFLIINSLFTNKKNVQLETEDHHSLKQELKIWANLIKKIWHLYFYLLSIILLDTSFWTAGILLAEQIKETSFWGNFLIPAYVFPSLFMSLLAGKLARKYSKKKIAFTASLIGAMILLIGLLTIKNELIVLVVFVSSFFMNISFPEIYAVFEDYIARLKDFGNDMIGLEGSAVSLAYIIGPILTGLLSSFLSLQLTMAIFAGLLIIMSSIALFIVPKKIKMPQQELNQECQTS